MRAARSVSVSGSGAGEPTSAAAIAPVGMEVPFGRRDDAIARGALVVEAHEVDEQAARVLDPRRGAAPPAARARRRPADSRPARSRASSRRRATKRAKTRPRERARQLADQRIGLQARQRAGLRRQRRARSAGVRNSAIGLARRPDLGHRQDPIATLEQGHGRFAPGRRRRSLAAVSSRDAANEACRSGRARRRSSDRARARIGSPATLRRRRRTRRSRSRARRRRPAASRSARDASAVRAAAIASSAGCSPIRRGQSSRTLQAYSRTTSAETSARQRASTSSLAGSPAATAQARSPAAACEWPQTEKSRGSVARISLRRRPCSSKRATSGRVEVMRTRSTRPAPATRPMRKAPSRSTIASRRRAEQEVALAEHRLQPRPMPAPRRPAPARGPAQPRGSPDRTAHRAPPARWRALRAGRRTRTSARTASTPGSRRASPRAHR